MIPINIITIGKVDTPYLTLGIKDYQARLSHFAKFSHISVPELNAPNQAGAINAALIKEGEQILTHVNQHDFVYVLAIEGEKLSSEAFATSLAKVIDRGQPITFIIGGSNGLSPAVKARANLSLSFSNLTFPHQIAQFLLYEQLYRAFKIINNQVYHK